MATKPACSPNGWTVDTLEKYLSDKCNAISATVQEQDERNKERFGAAKEQVNLALVNAEKAISKAEAAAEKRFEGLNELRGMALDQGKNFLQRAEYSVQHQVLVEKI